MPTLTLDTEDTRRLLAGETLTHPSGLRIRLSLEARYVPHAILGGPEDEDGLNRLAASLHIAWRKYTESFGEPPHGTLQQLRAMLCFLPKPTPEPVYAATGGSRPCPWCDEGNPPVLSSVTDVWVHPDTPVGRVVCGNRQKE